MVHHSDPRKLLDSLRMVMIIWTSMFIGSQTQRLQHPERCCIKSISILFKVQCVYHEHCYCVWQHCEPCGTLFIDLFNRERCKDLHHKPVIHFCNSRCGGFQYEEWYLSQILTSSFHQTPVYGRSM